MPGRHEPAWSLRKAEFVASSGGTPRGLALPLALPVTSDTLISRKTLRSPPKAECLQGETDGDAVPGGNGRLALMARSVG